MVNNKNTIRITVDIRDDKGRELPNSLTDQEYNYVSYQEVLMIERCLLNAFMEMNEIGQRAMSENNSKAKVVR